MSLAFRVIIIYGVLLIAVSAFSRDGGDHNFSREQCRICHVGNNRPSRYNLTTSITRSCLTCHQDIFDEGYMHPVDIKANDIHVPIDFPLSADGLITCVTCHDVHSSARNNCGGKTNFLRRQAHGKAFCDICHLNTLSAANAHEPVFSKAHFTSKYIVNNTGNTIDAMSRDCISCHDGSVGSSVELKAGNWRHSTNFLKFDDGGMHPIGMNYETTRRKNWKAALKPIDMVDKRIRFFGRGHDKMGCGSCHDPFSRSKNKLVISNVHSKLCLACHGMAK